MAKMLKQKIKGLRGKTLVLDISDSDLSALTPLLEGEVETFDQKGSGGTSAPLPANLNRKVFTVGKKTPTGRMSAQVNLPHVKETKHYAELSASMIGAFDATYASSEKAEYAKLTFDA